MSSSPIPVKLVVVGDGAIGKTCILVSYSQNRFPRQYVPTIFDNSTTTIKVDGKIVNLGLWDTAGQEQYARLRPLAYSNADIFLIVFSVIQRQSFTNALKVWYPQVHKTVPQAYKVIVGNKIDLRKQGSKDCIWQDEARQKLKGFDCKYYECSALTREGLVRIFEESAREAIARKERTWANSGQVQQAACPSCQLI